MHRYNKSTSLDGETHRLKNKAGWNSGLATIKFEFNIFYGLTLDGQAERIKFDFNLSSNLIPSLVYMTFIRMS